ncbi:MAG TPA: hypothetical protein VF179_02695 [Thermoanaerobaculia bacterium]|nr:hypothetical protein [Thermoanaerobaculia bacterium]
MSFLGVLLLAAAVPQTASAQMSVTGTVSPRQVSYVGTLAYSAAASGGDPATTQFAYFRRRPGGTWIPSVNSPSWQPGTTFTWRPTLSDVGVWETYVWVKDGNTPASQNTYGYAAGYNTQPIEVFGPPTPPGATAVSCAYSSSGECWATGDFTASVPPSTGGLGSLSYQICRSNDTTGWGGCDVNLTLSGGTSITVSGSHLPADGYRRAYYFLSHDSGGASSGWNTPLYVRVDRHAPTVGATNASDTEWFSSRTATVAASDAGSGVQGVRYSWNAALDAACTTGTATSPGATLTAPGGDNTLYLCAKDNVSRVTQWSGRYRVTASLSLTCSVSPVRESYVRPFTWTASASGGIPSTTRFAFFRRRPGGTWVPDVTVPNWQAGNTYGWTPSSTDAGVWETYVWVKDGNTPANQNTYGYAAGCNPGPIEVVGKPTLPGPTTVACAYATGDDCWVPGDFTISVSASTGGMGSLVYQICRSEDSTGGFAGCPIAITIAGGTSFAVTGTHLPSDGFRRSYWFQARDSAGALSGWNTPRYVRVDRYEPTVSASNASDSWFPSRTATVAASDAGSGLQGVRYSWNTALDAACTTGTAITTGTTLTAPAGDNTLYLCAKDNVSRVTQWSGRYRVATSLSLACSVSPARESYVRPFTWTASASGGIPSTTRFAFFRRRPGGTWVPDVTVPNWQAGNTYAWTPSSTDAGVWETYVWVKDGNTPANQNTYGYAAGCNPGPIEVVGKPTLPGPTTVACAYATGDDCWVTGDFTISVAASTGGMGSLVYQICRSEDSTGGFAGCPVAITIAGGTSFAVTGTHLPSDGFRRSYWFQARDSAGALSGWNTPRYVRVDRYEPTVSASNASDSWFPSRTATVSASDAGSGLQGVRYSWNAALDAACTAGTATATGATLTAPAGDNLLYLCARDNAGRVAQWSGRYRVGQAPDFSLDLTPASASIARGGQAQFTISITADPRFTGTAALSVSGLPAAAHHTLQPAAIGAGETAALTVTTTAATPEGLSQITVMAAGGGLTRSAAAQLRVGSPQKPVLTRVTPSSFHNGGRIRVTVEGSFLSGATVSIADEQTNPDDPVSRVFPDAQVVSINPEGTSMVVEVDATDKRIMDFHNLVVDNGTDIEAIPVRVLPGGPLVDAWTPSQPRVGGLYALSIAGRNLAGTTLTPSVGGRIRLHSIETSDIEITALLEVLPNVPAGSMKLIVADSQGRTVEVPITIVMSEEPSLVSRNLTASIDGEELDASSFQRPEIWFQEFTIRDPDNTEVLPEGLRIQSIDREALVKRLAERTTTSQSISWEAYIRITIHLVNVQWQKVILYDPLTGAIGDDVLQGLSVGEGVPIGAFVLSAYLKLDLIVYFRLTETGYTFPRFCLEISYGTEITGFDGFAYEASYCTGRGWSSPGTGSVSNGEITGGDCASVTPMSFEHGIVRGIVEQNACCSQPIGVAMSGHAFTGLPWARSFNVNSSQAGTTTSDQATCECPCAAAIDGTLLQPGGLSIGNIKVKNMSSEPCTYQYEVRQASGDTQMELANYSGTLTVGPQQTVAQPFTVTFPPGRPATDVATLEVVVQQTNPEGRQLACHARSISCVYPEGETSTFESWWSVEPSDSARFLGHLTPSSTDFSGRAVTEVTPGSGSFDTCHIEDSVFPNYAQENLTGAIWNIVAGNEYHEADLIGMKCTPPPNQQCDLDFYYEAVDRTPCSMGTTQTMQMSCGPMDKGSPIIPYAHNTIRFDVTADGTCITRDDAMSPIH